MNNSIHKISIFLDFDCFQDQFDNHFHNDLEQFHSSKINEVKHRRWEVMNKSLINHFRESFFNEDYPVVEHLGTWIYAPVFESSSLVKLYNLIFEGRDNVKVNKENILKAKKLLNYNENRKNFLQFLDAQAGYIVRKSEFFLSNDLDRTCPQLYSELICQMLISGIHKSYDTCLLVSDSSMLIPIVKRLQDEFGRKVIQVGYQKCDLRVQCYGHIALENYNVEFE